MLTSAGLNFPKAPRFWAPFAVLCFMGAWAIGYHYDQMAAANVLAEKMAETGHANASMVANPALATLQKALQIAGLACLGWAVFLSFVTVRLFKPRPAGAPVADGPANQAPDIFQPILTQSEIEVVEDTASKRRGSGRRV